MADASDDLTRLRHEIDTVDDQILLLLNRRAELARAVGEAKREKGRAFYAPERERQVLDRLERGNPGPLPFEAIRHVYREIISASLALEAPLQIAFFGPEATFTHQAAVQQFGRSANFLACGTISDVFDAVERGRANYGVVPIENSTEGVVTHTLDTFVDSPLQICSEIHLLVRHDLLSVSGRLDEVQRVYSHAQALAQCRGWLTKNLHHAPAIEVPSTAVAARKVADDPTAAAIASELAGVLYNLKPIARQIQDSSQNLTRFLVIGQQSPPPTANDKTSLLFSIRDEVGILHRLLGSFVARNVNVTKIESRPSKKRAWDYIFFLDLEGHQQDKPVAEAISELRPLTQYLKILGSYPRGLSPLP